MRSKVKEWSNRSLPGARRYTTWTHRITWYEDGFSVRLKEESPEGVRNIIFKLPEERDKAEQRYGEFKANHK